MKARYHIYEHGTLTRLATITVTDADPVESLNRNSEFGHWDPASLPETAKDQSLIGKQVYAEAERFEVKLPVANHTIASLVRFAMLTLAIMEDHGEWDSGTLDAIHSTAVEEGLSDSHGGEDGDRFRSLVGIDLDTKDAGRIADEASPEVIKALEYMVGWFNHPKIRQAMFSMGEQATYHKVTRTADQAIANARANGGAR